MTDTSPNIRVLVVDDDSEVRHGICDLLECYSDMEVVGEAEDGLVALDSAKRLLPDVLLLDVGLPSLSGIEVARKLHHSIPSVRIIMLTRLDVELVVKAMDGNAQGCLLKSAARETLPQAIRAVHRDELWMPESGLRR